MDDGSTDESLSIIQQFQDRILWETGSNRGGNSARNRLLDLAQGEWLQYLDADDCLLPEKVANQMEFLKRDEETDVVFGPVTLEHWSESNSYRELLEIPEPRDQWVLLARWNLPQTGASLWRKQAVMSVGGWRVDQPCCQEHELYLRLLKAGKVFRYCSHNGAVYRQWTQDTVCNRDQPEVHRRKLEIESHAESFLRSRDQLTPERLWAINQARFEVARMAWQYAPSVACEIMQVVAGSLPDFLPRDQAAPPLYRLTYRLFGFRLAEQLATVTRAIRK